MRIAVKRDAIWPHLNHAIQRAMKTNNVLFGQAIDEVNVDRRKAVGTGGINGGSGFRFALNAIDRTLHLLIKILHAHTHAVKTQPGEGFNLVRIHGARIDLD